MLKRRSTRAIWLSIWVIGLLLVHGTTLHATGPGKNKKLGNPDGYFIVASEGILKIKVTGMPDASCYSINMYVVIHEDPRIRAGRLERQGRWFPSWQQFYTQPYMNFDKHPGCNRLAEGCASFSRLVVAEKNIPMGGGETCSGFKNINEAPPGRVPDEKFCREAVALYCIPKCTKWEKNDFNQNYYVKDRKRAFRIHRYLNSPEYTPPPKTKVTIRVQGAKKRARVNRKPETSLEAAITGAWKATVDNQIVEMAFWPDPDREDQFGGYLYVPKHDCLMFANIRKDFDQSAHRYGKYGELALRFGAHHIKNRKNNCHRIIKKLDGATFSGGGYVKTDENPDRLHFESRSFYLDKAIASSRSKVKTINVDFTRCTASRKFVDIIESYDPPYIGRPYEGFTSEISTAR